MSERRIRVGRAARHLSIAGALVVAAVAQTSPAGPGRAAAQPAPVYDADAFYREVRVVVRRYYPEATSHQLGAKLHFEHDTRVFVVHEPLKTGEWQDPWEERGPKSRGIVGDMEVVPGRWRGAAVVPQSFDRRYFTHLLMAPYSAELDAHLHVSIKYPGAVPDGFLKEMTELVTRFDRYVTRRPA